MVRSKNKKIIIDKHIHTDTWSFNELIIKLNSLKLIWFDRNSVTITPTTTTILYIWDLMTFVITTTTQKKKNRFWFEEKNHIFLFHSNHIIKISLLPHHKFNRDSDGFVRYSSPWCSCIWPSWYVFFRTSKYWSWYVN